MFFNARSLKSKLADFNALLANDNFDIICVVESWLNDTVTDAMLTNGLPFNVIRLDRPSRGGGVLVCYRSNIICGPPTFSSVSEGLHLDFVQSRFRLVLGYLPDGKEPNAILEMCNFLRDSISTDYTSIVVGDFNMSSIDWSALSVSAGVSMSLF